jgi:hypothetical protein
VPALYRNLGKGLFEDVVRCRPRRRNRFVEGGAGLPDLDNDGLQDLFVTGNVYPEIERCCRSIHTAVHGSCFGTSVRAIRTVHPGRRSSIPHPAAAPFGDIDNDGDIDVLVMNITSRLLLRNDYSGRAS